MNSIGNEISELAIPEGQEYCKKLAVLARKLDPDKAVTMGVNLMLCSMSAKAAAYTATKRTEKRIKTAVRRWTMFPPAPSSTC